MYVLVFITANRKIPKALKLRWTCLAFTFLLVSRSVVESPSDLLCRGVWLKYYISIRVSVLELFSELIVPTCVRWELPCLSWVLCAPCQICSKLAWNENDLLSVCNWSYCEQPYMFNLLKWVWPCSVQNVLTQLSSEIYRILSGGLCRTHQII